MSATTVRTKKALQKVKYTSKNTPYDKFLGSIHNDKTKQSYIYYFNEFFKFCKLHDRKLQEYDQLLHYSDNERYNQIQDYIMFQLKKKLSFSTMNGSNSAIKLFFESNGIEIRNWKQLSRLKGKHRLVIKNRLYRIDEIKRLLEYADVREKVIILTMLSSGMRVGALAGLKLEDIQKIAVNEKGFEIYRFEPYSEDSNENYITFCTPECTKAIDLYLDERTKNNEKLGPESPFITHKIDSRHVGRDRGFLGSRTIQKLLERQRYDAKIMEPTTVKKTESILKNNKNTKLLSQLTRKEVMSTHGFRKYFNTACNKIGMNFVIKEKLMGHKVGLEAHYDRTDESTLLQEYIKVIDELTINDENRLRIKATQLEKEVEDINILKQQVQELMKEKDKIESNFIDVVQQSYDNETYTQFELQFLRKEIERLKGIKSTTPTTTPKMTPKERKKLERRKINFSLGKRRWKKIE